MPNALHEFRKLAWRAGGRDLLRIEANGKYAIHKGMMPKDVLACLTKNTPELFDEKLALERQRLPSNHNSNRGKTPPSMAACGRKEKDEMSNVTIDVTAKATEVAKKAGAIYPETVAEFLKNDLTIVDSAAGPQVMFRNGMGYEPLDFVMSRLKITENVGALFHGGKLDVKNLSHDLYRAIRKHSPELIGLRSKRRFV